MAAAIYLVSMTVFVIGTLSGNCLVFVACWLGAGILIYGFGAWWTHTWAERNAKQQSWMPRARLANDWRPRER